MAASRRVDRPTFSELFPQLFLFPLVIVVVCVLVYLLFVASGKDSRDIRQLIIDIESGGELARKQDAYSLAVEVRNMGPQETLDEELTRKLLGLREQFGEEAEFAKYITLALGRVGDPTLTLPLMRELATQPRIDPDQRITAVTALGLMLHTPSASEVLVQVVEAYPGPDDWELRWRALGGLTNLQHPTTKPLLVKALQDTRREIRWSAACWLAGVFRDPTGAAFLEELVSWEFLDAERGEDRELRHDEKEGYMIQALRGLVALRGGEARSLLERLARDDRSFKVRDAALRALDEMADKVPDSAVPAGIVPNGVSPAGSRRSDPVVVESKVG